MSVIQRLIPALVTSLVGIWVVWLFGTWRSELPDPVATHWGSGSAPDGFTTLDSMVTMFWVVIGIGVLVCLVTLVPKFDAKMRRILAGMACGTTVFILVLMLVATGAQRGLTDASQVPLSPLALLAGLVAGLGLGVLTGWLVPPDEADQS